MKDKIKEKLIAKIIANEIYYFDEIDSTQKIAKEFAEKQVNNGTVILANNQIKGIGTHDRKWYSEKEKNISFTLIIYPKCEVNNLDTLTIDIAENIVKTIYELYGIKLEIKNPNDIVYNKKKLGGILTQITTIGKQIKYLLIGIGINVNSIQFQEEIKDIATSLKIEFNQEFSREEIIAGFCNNFEKYCIDKKII